MTTHSLPWTEIVKQYPDQWVSLINLDKEGDGTIRSAVVTGAASDLKTLTRILKQSHAISDRFEYTGVIKNFLGFARWTIANDTPPAK